MKTAHQFSEASVRKHALEYQCPTCGAATGVRCRILTPNKTAPGRTKVDVMAKPHPGRTSLAWREMLLEDV